MANTAIVTTETEAVKVVTVEEVDQLKVVWEATCTALALTYDKVMAHPGNLHAIREARAALAAEQVAHLAWKTGENALQAQWRAEDTEYETFLCEQFDAMDNAVDPYGSLDPMNPIPYSITPTGVQYLDHHYATHSNAGMLASGGDSPYSDGTTGYIQPTPAHPCYSNGVCDMDALTHYEDLSY